MPKHPYVFVGLLLLGISIVYLVTGRIPRKRGRTISRERQPMEYWFSLLVQLAMGGGLILYAMHEEQGYSTREYSNRDVPELRRWEDEE